jgi:hypothetical protein
MIITIICHNATIDVGFQTVDRFALVAITGMMWHWISSSLDYPLGLPIRKMKSSARMQPMTGIKESGNEQGPALLAFILPIQL